MLISFFLNGLGPFGLRVLAGLGVGEQYTPIYLVYWYLGGLVFLGTLALVRGQSPSKMEILIGSLVGLSSMVAQFSMGLALAQGAPGNVVYPIAHSSVFVVAIAGVLMFKERVGNYGKAGIAVGILAVVLLSVFE
jgi:drug/metabolite transporter (DMT)-like permease